MISAKKIRTLKPRVQLRKCANLMYQMKAEDYSDDYLRSLADIVDESALVPAEDKKILSRLFSKCIITRDPLVGKDIHCLLLRILGQEAADWDMVTEDGRLDAGVRTVKPHSLFLDRIRSPYNIGAIFRSAESFCVDHIYLREGCGDVRSPRCIRTSRGAVDVIPYTVVSSLDFLKERECFALETGGESLSAFTFPSDAICVLGSEEDGVSPDVLSLCSGKVSIEQYGAKGSVNVSVAAGILLYSWAMS